MDFNTTKESIAFHIKAWVKVTFILWVGLILFNMWHCWVNNYVQNQTELDLISYGGVIFHYVLMWFLLPIYVFRKLKKFFNKNNEPQEAIIISAIPFVLKQGGMDYENQQKRA